MEDEREFWHRRFDEVMVRHNELSELVAKLTMRVVRDEPHTPASNSDDRGLKIDINDFDGSLDPELYIEWERSIERFFEYRETPPGKQFKLAKLKLTKHAAIWLEGLQKQRQREDKAKIQTWAKLKKALRKRFVPSNYAQMQYIKWSTLKQGIMSVADYVKEFERLAIICEIEERDEQKLSRFMAGLNQDIFDRLELQPCVSYDEACKLAVKIEEQRKRWVLGNSSRGAASKIGTSSGSYVDKTPTKTPDSKGTTTPITSSAGSNLKSVNDRAIDSGSRRDGARSATGDGALPKTKCFKCQGYGHYQRDCPNARVMTMMEMIEWEKMSPSTEEKGEAQEVDSSEDSDGECDQCPPEVNLILRRSLHIQEAEHLPEQREQIFQTKCRIGDELCDLIVDGGSMANVASQELVDRLNLKTTKHPYPYKLRWLDEKGVRVRKQCLVAFQIGSYSDKILCDVVNMDACHVLLGRPWQSDRESMHDGVTNVYTIKKNGRKKVLYPLPRVRPPPKPKELLMGSKTVAGQARDEIRRSVNVAKEIKRNNRVFHKGDLVWADVSRGKFSSKMKRHKKCLLERSDGPYEVLEQESNGWYRVALSSTPKVSAMFKKEELTPCFDHDLLELRAIPFEEGGNDPSAGMEWKSGEEGEGQDLRATVMLSDFLPNSSF